MGIHLVLFYQTEETLLLPTAQFSASEEKLCSKNSELLTIPFPSTRAPEKQYCSTLLSRPLLTSDLQAWTAPRAGREFLQGTEFCVLSYSENNCWAIRQWLEIRGLGRLFLEFGVESGGYAVERVGL